MNFKLEYLLIPENLVYMKMKTSEFDAFIKSQIDGDHIVYEYIGRRYLFFDDDFVLEEVLE